MHMLARSEYCPVCVMSGWIRKQHISPFMFYFFLINCAVLVKLMC